ncbi:MAG TPA: T9SS type A sorting domain-containing protein [Flavipsychrobacter sp.]|nr:T9SS type A sorting domain-containing protein [Flavipsychrobacter sp.]
MTKINASWTLSQLNTICILQRFAEFHDIVFQSQQQGYNAGKCPGAGNPNGGEGNIHAATIASLSNSWRLKPPGPLGAFTPQWLWPNVTKQMLELTSLRCDLRYPHIPLIYRIFHGGPLLQPQNPPANLSSYASRLDLAPQCGIYNYTKKNVPYTSFEWSSDDRLTESKRRGDNNQDRETVGLDYMLLFNLYLANDGGYASFYSNPYYEVNHNHTYPYVLNGVTYASHTAPKQENYLEYVSSISWVTSTGNVTYRGAKVIDLLPGFKADYGSTFLANVQDFTCCNAPHTIASPNNPFNLKMSNGAFDPFLIDTSDVQGFVPVEIPEPGESQYYASMSELEENAHYWKEQLLKTGDSAAIKFFNALYKQDEQVKKETIELKVYPNPANDHINLDFSSAGDFFVRIYNMIGEKVFEVSLMDNKVFEISTSNWQSGSYVITVIGNAQHFATKINIIK